jgi:hypothetical protein
VALETTADDNYSTGDNVALAIGVQAADEVKCTWTFTKQSNSNKYWENSVEITDLWDGQLDAQQDAFD